MKDNSKQETLVKQSNYPENKKEERPAPPYNKFGCFVHGRNWDKEWGTLFSK